jgi:hypothetical protein
MVKMRYLERIDIVLGKREGLVVGGGFGIHPDQPYRIEP